jgi:hypothetical protein
VDPKSIITLVKSLKLGAETEKKVFGENARALFKL